MNQFFLVPIAEKISAMETADFFAKRAAQANTEAANAAWGKVASLSPLAGDVWTAPVTQPSGS